MTYTERTPDEGQPYRPGGPAPIEKKVIASAFSTGALVALLTAILSLVEGDQLIEGTPDWVPVVLGSLIAAGGAFTAGRAAPHTARPDLPPAQR